MPEPTTSETQVFDTFAIVEIFGHLRLAGKVTEQTIAGHGFLRIDVPAVGEQQAYTRFFGADAVYSITPVSEEIARAMCAHYVSQPVSPYELRMLAASAEPSGDKIEADYLPHDDEDVQF